MASNQQKIQDLQSRISKERKIIHGFQVMRTATSNQDIIRSCDSKIRDSEKTISFYQQSIQELESPSEQSPTAPTPTSSTSLQLASPIPKSVKRYTALDLIKYDTPLTAAKIGRMLHQLEFKICVESQYKNGIEKMIKLYQLEGDKKSRAEAERKRVESSQKMLLLGQALKRYKTLEVTGIEDEDAESEERKGHPRRPISGALQITITSARDLDHAPLSSKKGTTETVVVVKVEDTPRARTHPVRNDRWHEEFEIHVDKANELEIIIYDRISSNQDSVIPIGLLWVRINDVVEELRRKKIGNESGPGWVTAARVNSRGGGSAGELAIGGSGSSGSPITSLGSQPPGIPTGGNSSEGIEAWFAVEPAGAIGLNLNFVKSNVRKRPYETAGLGRQGAVRKKKEEVHEQNGHQFIAQQFYQIVRCALCGELLYNASGMQCSDCKYLCHKRCFTKVVTKCISKSNADADEDEEKMLNHRIPHRFEPMTTITPAWCCHCGMLLPLGRKNARRCTECSMTSHADCAHLVPDFCGMSMETANRLLQEIKTAKTRQHTRLSSHSPLKQDHIGSPNRPSATSTIESAEKLHQEFGRVQLGAPLSTPPSTDYHSRVSSTNIQPPLSAGHTPVPIHLPYGESDGQERPSGSRPLPTPMEPMRMPEPPPPGLFGPGPPLSSGPASRPLPPQPQPRLSQGPPANTSPQQMTSPQQQPTSNRYDPRITSPPMSSPTKSIASPITPSGSSTAIISTPASSRSRSGSKAQRKIGLDDFNFLAVLGKGNFGKVMLAEEKRSGQLWAIKVLKKDFIIENDEVESTKSEKRVFLTASRERHPFLIGLHSCFQTETRIYFVMEYVSGGDLMLHIQREQFTPRRAKFYAAEVLLALEYFHQNGVIYRDLKLDNILLTLDGHIKVADYGLCKEEMWYQNTTSTFCGTPEFMAPEILLEQRYGRAVDWWAFGVLIYEMLLGQSPFRGDDEDEIFDAILEDEPLYPIHMPRDSVSILQKLLTRDPLRRLGGGPTDAEEIKAHPFFRETVWEDVYRKRVPAPYFPTVNGPMDVSNFDSEFTKESPRLTPVHSQLRAEDQKEFEGFSWTAPWAQ
ncbi:uncharacterized protein MELLADRAFT_85936 [Melampsora larici-populina 98AG31]|uniref:protein kinase C n=1 Tax=Melampsora larici-populina (strain 98AG31 / pathotype 3-4-7) TaxID=747676 RepID=F4RK76_MELLP|nr:uncharacterized protein MELLADRAFT_85936 [Melampsora larici-populina 98AG31]EGG07050.1 hypothetical protein MELLADRAFT_85936 [Melampsora larici-populina 98AG31]